MAERLPEILKKMRQRGEYIESLREQIRELRGNRFFAHPDAIERVRLGENEGWEEFIPDPFGDHKLHGIKGQWQTIPTPNESWFVRPAFGLP